jgi:hypothetical protein
VPTHNSKGLSWEYPLLDPALPLPPASATHLGSDGSPSPSTSRTASAPIDICRPAAPRPRGPASAASSAGASSPGAPGDSLAGSPGSFGAGGSSFGSARGASGPFAVGCVAPSCFMWSELAQAVNLAEALTGGAAPCCAPGLPRPLAAAALAAGALVEVSVWVAGPPPPVGGRSGSRPAGARPAGAGAAPQVQVLAALVPAADEAAAAAAGVPLIGLLKAAAPFADSLPSGLPPAEAAPLLTEAATGGLATMGLHATQLAAAGPRPVGPDWAQIKLRLRVPPAPPGACAEDVLAAAPRLVIALRGRAGAFGLSAAPRAGGRGPKFMAARVSLVALDDE